MPVENWILFGNRLDVGKLATMNLYKKCTLVYRCKCYSVVTVSHFAIAAVAVIVRRMNSANDFVNV